MQYDRRTLLKATGAAGAASLLPGAAAAGAPTLSIDSTLDLSSAEPQEVIVVFESRDDADRLRHLDLAEGYVTFNALPMAYTLLTGAQLRRVGSWPEVRYVQANHEVTFDNEDARNVTGARVVQERLHYTGETVHAVVIDSGIDGDHPDFANTLEHNFRFVHPTDAENAMWTDAGPADTASLGHGTHVSGSLTGEGTASDGQYAGMAPDAKLTVYSTDVVAGLLQIVAAYDHMLEWQRAGRHDVQVVNNSYSATHGNDYTPDGAMEVATWAAFREGITPVFSAGNEYDNNLLSDYSIGPHILCSAATDDGMRVTEFSSKGRPPSYDGGGEGAHYDRQAAFENLERYYDADLADRPVVASETRTGTVGPGAEGVALAGKAWERIDAPAEAGYLMGSVSWIPPGEDIDVFVHEGAQDGPVVASGASLANPETFSGQITPGETYWVEILPYANVAASYTLEFSLHQAHPAAERPSGPYGIYRPSVGTPGKFVMSTFSPDDPLQAYPTIWYGQTAELEKLQQEQTEQIDEPYYGQLSGTSMSGPVLAGLVALVYDAYRQEHGAWPDPLDVITTVEATARAALASHTTHNIGAGFADVTAAVELAVADELVTIDEYREAVTLADDAVEPLFVPQGYREDGASAYTAGQTCRVTLTLTGASEAATVRDRIPFEWTVVGGDAHTVYTENGDRYLEFDDAVAEGESVTYLLEAPPSSGRYEFGPAEAMPAAESDPAFTSFTGTELNNVLGVDQNSVQ